MTALSLSDYRRVVITEWPRAGEREPRFIFLSAPLSAFHYSPRYPDNQSILPYIFRAVSENGRGDGKGDCNAFGTFSSQAPRGTHREVPKSVGNDTSRKTKLNLAEQ